MYRYLRFNSKIAALENIYASPEEIQMENSIGRSWDQKKSQSVMRIAKGGGGGGILILFHANVFRKIQDYDI